MSEYTPDTEDVAYCYEGPDLDAGERRAAFYRWFAAEIAAAKAEALREAAEAWQVETEGVRPGPWNFMRRRADQISEGNQP